MRLGFYTACLSDIPLPDVFRWARENGFAALEIDAGLRADAQGPYKGASVHAEGITPQNADDLLKLARDNSIAISCLTYCDNMLDNDLAAREKRVQHLLKVIQAAALLDVDVVSCFVGRDKTKDIEGNYGVFKDVFAPVMAAAASSGVRIAVENCPGDWMYEGLPGNIAYSPLIWRRLFEIFPDMGLNFDPSHLVWIGVDWCKAAAEFAPHIYHVHAKDTEILQSVLADRSILPPRQPRWWRYRVPGFGVIDWARFISVLTEGGYDGPLSIEQEDPVWRGDEARVKQGLVLGRKHLEKFVA